MSYNNFIKCKVQVIPSFKGFVKMTYRLYSIFLILFPKIQFVFGLFAQKLYKSKPCMPFVYQRSGFSIAGNNFRYWL